MQPLDLFGRDAELDRLTELLVAGRAVAVVGEAGVGKTTLVRAAGERAGLQLREGGALETLAWTPHLALRRAVGDGLRGDPTAVAIEVEQRLGPQLLFIDDLQWTDDATRSVLALLAGRVAVVMTVRTPDPHATGALVAVVEAGALLMELSGVAPDAAMAIVRRARPSIAPGALRVVVEQAGGNPLLLEELASRGRPSSSLARALTSRLDRLGPAGRRSFALLAVAGHALPSAGKVVGTLAAIGDELGQLVVAVTRSSAAPSPSIARRTEARPGPPTAGRPGRTVSAASCWTPPFGPRS